MPRLMMTIPMFNTFSPRRISNRFMPPLRLLAIVFLLGSALPHAALFAADQPAGTVKLVMVGDIMFANDQETGKLVARGENPFQPFANVLTAADVSIANLECVVAEQGEKVAKPYNYLANPTTCMPLLQRYFTGLSVANNHSCDYGKAAFARQCEIMHEKKMPYFGGGRNLAEAHTPWIIDRNGVRIAMLGYCEVFLSSYQAAKNEPGIAWSEHEDEVVADLKAAHEKYKADVVIPYMHWGREGDPANEREKTFARKMIDAGADIVVGAHPHITQGAEYYQGHLIVYSLGNFLFNGFDTEPTRTGWALRLMIGKQGLESWDTVVARLDEQHGVPRPDFTAKSPSGRAGTAEIVEINHPQEMPNHAKGE
jgi:poly-gamma-glutamate capsule biosynthesis protein CapA/YwtB (metallophosphatase superfamily)